MLGVRVIPCLDVKDGRVVKGVNFVGLRDAGDPVALRRVEDRLTGIEEQLGAIRSIEAAMSRSLLRLSQ